MGARFRSWCQQLRRRKVAIAVTTAIIVVAVTLIVVGYSFDRAGFNRYTQVSTIHTLSGPTAGTVTRTEALQPGKTLWDWLQLLIVPLVLAIIALVFQVANSRTERQLAKQRYEQDQQIALDKQREDLLQIYLDRMSELLLKEKPRSSEVDAEVRNVARVRTITILFQLDARRIGYIFAFLREAGLMSTIPNDSIVSLKNANLEKINFSQANLSEADLSNANLKEADLRGADLSNANLSRARLNFANLSRARLNRADLREAKLSGAKLSGAKLRSALLEGAYLNGANLSGAVVTEEQLKEANSLEHAIMPDGSIHS